MTTTVLGFARGVVLGLVSGAMILGAGSALAADQVNVRFSWKLKGEYAPLYLARENGEFAARDLSVRMGEGAGSPAALGALIQGQEDVVVMPAIFALSAIQRGMPVKIVALYHPHTPVVLISHPENPITRPEELEGKTVAHAIGETGTSYLDVFCEINDIDCGKISKVQMDARARIPQFLQHQVDAVSAYLSNDLPMLEARTGKRFPRLNLGEYGLPLLGLSVVSSNAAIANQPDVLQRFLAAVSEAMATTRSAPEVAAKALRQSWDGAPDLDIVIEQVRATIEAIPEIEGKPAGWIRERDIQAALDMLASAGEIDDPKPVETFYTNRLLEQ